MSITVDFWNRTNEMGMVIKQLEGYKRFESVSFSCSCFDYGRISVSTEDCEGKDKFGIYGLSVTKERDHTFTLQFWGATTANRLKTQNFHKLKDLLRNIEYATSLANQFDKDSNERK